MTATRAISREQATRTGPPVVDLGAPEADDPRLVGAKAASLARLQRAGFAVPRGFVVTAGADTAGADRAALVAALAALGDRPVAVRSSAVAEDTANASYAGQYETVLGVRGVEAVIEAIDRVRASASSAGVSRYRAEQDREDASMDVAVLIQPMVDPDAAGVAFTADPVTGDRTTVVVTAVPGLGDRLAAGEVTPDEWSVRKGVASPRRDANGAMDASLVCEIAAVAQRIEADAGVPQDVEWAAVAGNVVVLQARPMTAVPDAVTWVPGQPGVWLRNFRLGEWLGGPVSPLFESWALTTLEARMHDNYAAILGGMRMGGPLHVLINGWYFYGGLNVIPTTPRQMVPALVRYILPSFIRHPRRTAIAFPPLARFGVELFHREWRETLQPRYRRAVSVATAELPSAHGLQLVALVDSLLQEAGDYFTSITAVAGYATKAELPLARFYARYLAPRIGGSHLDLLSGIGDEPPGRNGHAVTSLDWLDPLPETGELDTERAAAAQLHAKARETRLAAEQQARQALRDDPRALRRFERLLGDAQRYGRAREEQSAEFTLPWPSMRAAVTLLGKELRDAGTIERPEQVFFLERDELVRAVAGDRTPLAARAEERRRAWQRQAGLTPPLLAGTLSKMLERVLENTSDALRGGASNGPALKGVLDGTEASDTLFGIPASAGHARGPARVVRSASEFDRVQHGDVLVASMTTTAWTPLFGRVAGIVTDNGGVGAHASVVAREYGLPAVVGTGDATRRFHDGEILEVDGSSGSVRRAVSPH